MPDHLGKHLHQSVRKGAAKEERIDQDQWNDGYNHSDNYFHTYSVGRNF